MSDAIFPAELIARHVRDGFWADRTIYDHLVDAAARQPDRVAVVDGERRFTYGELPGLVDRVAANLFGIGVRPGDRVVMQLPNWYEVVLVEWALMRLGAVCTPLPPIYRQRELSFMLQLVQPKVVIAPQTFRNWSYPPMYLDLLRSLPCVEGFYIARAEGEPGDGMRRFEELLSEPPVHLLSALPARVDPNAISEIAFTSGTTGEPKGVIHTHNTNLSPLRDLVRRQELGESDVVLMASTFGHQTGFVYGGQLPVLIGGCLVLMDTWNPDVAVALIEREGVTWLMGATPFLQDLTEATRRLGRRLKSLRIFLCSGAPVPQPLLVEARDQLGCCVLSGWGMTELGLVTLTDPRDPTEKVTGTDGYPSPGFAVRVVDEDGNDLPPGEDGDLLTRGHNMFAGYYRRPEVTASLFTADGWFRTGDRAKIDADGYIRIVGRSKDLVIRGGENIPVVEVENLLHKHPKIWNVAIVAMPDPRLQERACAFVVLRPGETFSFQEMTGYLTAQHLAKQYLPERLEVVDAFPTTPSGKVQKFVLRRRIAEIVECESRPAARENPVSYKEGAGR